MSGYRLIRLMAIVFLCSNVSMHALGWPFGGTKPSWLTPSEKNVAATLTPAADPAPAQSSDANGPAVAPVVAPCRCPLRAVLPTTFLGKVTLTGVAMTAILYGVYSSCMAQEDAEDACS